jgi:hypothetical protein
VYLLPVSLEFLPQDPDYLFEIGHAISQIHIVIRFSQIHIVIRFPIAMKVWRCFFPSGGHRGL